MVIAYILIATLIVSLVSLVGALLLLAKNIRADKTILYAVGFAAGALLATAFFDILPEALEEAHGNDIFPIVFLGIVISYILEKFLLWFHHHDEEHGYKPSALLLTIGDAAHNFVDGVVIAGSFFISVPLGIITSLAIVAHEVPQELADFTVLIHSGLSNKRAFIYNFISASSAFAGAIMMIIFSSFIADKLYIFLALTGGMFIYIATADLIPELHKSFVVTKRWLQLIPFLLGVAVIVIVGMLLAPFAVH